MTDEQLFDPKGLIREAFAIEGISAPECRSIFLDWALGLPPGRDVRAEVRPLISHYAPRAPADHPMLGTLRAALEEPATPKRRGGRAGRF
ncbi:hypothetical protein [Yoonia sp.]|uniref:hypothetical protein n=1 Tax=Yoonia sp. TaxID=2212373 RepID=UPI00358F64BC